MVRISNRHLTDSSRSAGILPEVQPVKSAVALLAVLGLSIAGYLAFWPYLRDEYPRFELWKVVLLFLSDTIALLWFLWAIAKYVTGKGAPRRTIFPHTGFGWGLLVAAIIGIGLDLAMTLYQMHVEQSQYQNGQPTVADVLRATKAAKPARTRYRFMVRFRDSNGSVCETELETSDSKEKGWLHGTSDKLISQLQSGRVKQLPIRYDRSWPQRAWIEGIGPDEDSLLWFSLVVICFQAIFLVAGTCNFIMEMRKYVRKGRIPWWHDLHDLIPQSVEAALMLFSGLIYQSWSWTPLV